MAGTFWKMIPIFNRAPKTLYVFFDGERHPIPPGLSEIPERTLYHAKNQNPIMGSADPYNPGMAGARYLIVEKDDEGFGTSLTKDEWEEHCNRPCREDERIWFNERYGSDPKAKQLVRGSRNSVAARHRSEVTAGPMGMAEFTAKEG